MKIIRPQSRQPIPKNAKKVFSGIVFDAYQWQQKMFDGSFKTFEKLIRADTVVVFPVLNDGRILLNEQEQPGRNTSFISAFGGRVENGENILEAAKRELLEESGYKAREFILWQSEQPITKIEWEVYVFIAKNLKKVSDQKLDSGEKITLKPVTFDEFVDMATNKHFAEKEIVPELFEAKLDHKKYKELRKLFRPLQETK